MLGINSWSGSGNVASDVLMSETKSGDTACSFKIAVDEGHKTTVFVRVNAYGEKAEIAKRRMLKKGDYVVLKGELMNRQGRNDLLTEIRCKEIVIIAKQVEFNGFIQGEKENGD